LLAGPVIAIRVAGRREAYKYYSLRAAKFGSVQVDIG
jgi:hypothetical protein